MLQYSCQALVWCCEKKRKKKRKNERKKETLARDVATRT